MAVYATEENNKTDIADRIIEALLDTVNFEKHRIVLVDNASCRDARYMLQKYKAMSFINVIHNDENLGTAGAVNLAWKLRQPGECVVKMDDDCLIHDAGWCDQLEEAISRDPSIGIIGLKRKDLGENPWRNDGMRSTLRMLPHEAGQRWIIVEDVNHVMGTCQMYNPALLDKIGYLYQPRLYGFDDSLAAVRCRVAGFKSCFLPHIHIDHIDPGDTPFQTWKESHAAQSFVVDPKTGQSEYSRLVNGYQNGTIPIYYNPFE